MAVRPVQILQVPHLPPYICMSCRGDQTSERKWFMDTGFDAEWEGVVFLCDSCFKDMAKAAKFFDQEQVDNLLESYRAAHQHYKVLLDKLANRNKIWQELTGFSLEEFFQNLEKAREDGESSRQSFGVTESAIQSDAEPIRDDSGTKQNYLAINLA